MKLLGFISRKPFDFRNVGLSFLALHQDAVPCIVLYMHTPLVTEELIRCNTEAESCFEHRDGLEIRSEHSSRDGHIVLTGKVAKSGQYVCKADLGSGRSKTCTMNVDDRMYFCV